MKESRPLRLPPLFNRGWRDRYRGQLQQLAQAYGLSPQGAKAFTQEAWELVMATRKQPERKQINSIDDYQTMVNEL